LLFRSALLERKFLKKIERSEAPLRTAFSTMVAELNDLPEVTRAAEWRFREQLKPPPLTKQNGAEPTTSGGEFTK
jgi:hypothetical protein